MFGYLHPWGQPVRLMSPPLMLPLILPPPLSSHPLTTLFPAPPQPSVIASERIPRGAASQPSPQRRHPACPSAWSSLYRQPPPQHSTWVVLAVFCLANPPPSLSLFRVP